MEKAKVNFSYGDETVTVEIPCRSIIKSLEIGKVPPADNPAEAIEKSLSEPIGTRRLSKLAYKKKNILIMVPDMTRKCPLDIIIPKVVNELKKGGASEDSIKMLIGNGTHRAMTRTEMKTHFGKALFNRYEKQIYNHEWWNPEQLQYLGTTPNGTPIDVNRFVCEADLKIAIGAVKPHRDAGWSGGAKMIQPGVSSLRTTGYTHWLAAQYPVSAILGKNDNPVREEMEQIASQVGLDFIVNCVLTEHYDISGVFSGHYIYAHRAACDAARKYFTVQIDELCDVFICGSSAAQRSMWANASGPNWCELVLKKGGTVVMFAKCPDGVSEEHPEVLKYGYLPLDKIKELVESGKITDLPAASHMHHGGEKLYGEKNISCIIVSKGVSREKAAKLFLEYAETTQQAVDMALLRYGENARVYVYPSYYFGELIIENN